MESATPTTFAVNLPVTAPPPRIRSPLPFERAPLAELIRTDGLFQAEEVACALELIDAALADPDGDYRVRVAECDGRVAGYVCFGPTPMARGTFDLYWIATHPQLRARGCGSALVAAMESELRREGARLIRVETSALDGYGAARRFYARHHYREAARLRDFYRPGDDLLVMTKRL